MKKITLLLFFMSVLWGYAQVKSYTFSSSTPGAGAYVEINDVNYLGRTILGTTANDNQYFCDPQKLTGASSSSSAGTVGFPIGFSFVFNGYSYDRFGVNTNGWIGLGDSTLPNKQIDLTVNDDKNLVLSSTGAITPEALGVRIAALANNLSGQTGAELSFVMQGTAPNRVLVVQWKKYKRSLTTATSGEDFNFQIKLRETTNVVEFVYGTMTYYSGNVSAPPGQVGLRGEPFGTTSITNFNVRKTTTSWTNSDAGTSATDKMTLTDQIYPPVGLTYTWTPSSCGDAKAMVVSGLTDSSGAVSWGAYTPAPSGYEYKLVQVAQATDAPATYLPSASESGITPEGSSFTFSGKPASTPYFVYIRSKCSGDFTPWIYLGSFKTKCTPLASYWENFDSFVYNSSNQGAPVCWDNYGTTGSCYLTNGTVSNSVVSPTNAIYISLNASPSTAKVAYLHLPGTSTLQGNYRLRFRAYSTTATSSVSTDVELGYLSTEGDVSSFKRLGTANVIANSMNTMEWLTINPDPAIVIPQTVDHLVIKVAGLIGGSTTLKMVIDDVVWEPKSSCGDLSRISFNKVTQNSVRLAWTTSGTESTWQYATTPSNVYSSNGLVSLGDLPSNPCIIDGLAPGTSYNIWVRSKCGSDFGSWYSIGPVNTLCSPVDEVYESFDKIVNPPFCWRQVSVGGSFAIKAGVGTNGTEALELKTADATTPVVVSLPAFSNASTGAATIRFKMKSSAATTGTTVLSIGYLTDLANTSTYQEIVAKNISNDLNGIVEVNEPLGAIPQTAYVAFRFISTNAASGMSLYIDDFAWIQTPTCKDVKGISIKSVVSDSMKLNWTPDGNESEWEYTFGSSSDNSPLGLPVKSFVNPLVSGNTVVGDVTGLSSTTSYKLWMRSSCSGTSKGSWVGPIYFTTTCIPTDAFTEGFDTGVTLPNLPSCWNRVVGDANTIKTSSWAGATNVLEMSGTATSQKVVAMRPVVNAGANSNILNFSLSGTLLNDTMQVGYVTYDGVFHSLHSFNVKSTSTFSTESVDLGFEPSSNQILAFATATASTTTKTIYIDNVTWVSKPPCAGISDLKLTGITTDSVDLSWINGGSDNWDYVLAPATVSDPTSPSLTVVPFSSAVVGNPVEGVTTVSGHISGLQDSKPYNIWVRSNCGGSNLLGAWVGPLTFSTTCPAKTDFNENFESITEGINNVPACWARVGNTGTIAVSTVTGMSGATKVLTLGSTASAAGLAMVAMPPVNNAAANTYRLRFKLKASTTHKEIKVGYLSNVADSGSFHQIQSVAASSKGFETKIVYFGTNPSSQILAFSYDGLSNGAVYIDDVIWEPIPSCLEVSNVSIVNVYSSSVSLKWIKGNTETAWQYAVGDANDPAPATEFNDVVNPVVDGNNVTAVIPGFVASTGYRLWIRSNCNTSLSPLPDPVAFTTTCTPVSSFPQENFDSVNGTVMPNCWTIVGSTSLVSTGDSLKMASTSEEALGMVTLPPVSNASAGTHRLKFKMKGGFMEQDTEIYVPAFLEVGYVNDEGVFMPVVTVASDSKTEFSTKIVELGTGFKSELIAIRRTSFPTGTVYIDEVIWEPKPSCADIANVAVKLPTSNSVQLLWDKTGGESAWQYAYATSDVTDANAGNVVDTDVKSLTIKNLTPGTSYKVWVRSNCGNSAFGYWSAPVTFFTPCVSVNTIIENFDAGLNVPDCWRKLGNDGTVSVVAGRGTNNSKALNLVSSGPVVSVYALIPPLASAVSGGNKIKFKYSSTKTNATLKIVCYKDPLNLNGEEPFKELKTVVIPLANTVYTLDEVLPAAETPYLGLIVYGDNKGYADVSIDDFGLESPAILCASDVTAVPDECGDKATQISWSAVDNATGYKLSIGTSFESSDVMNNQDLGNVMSYSFSGKENTTYYYKVIPYNIIDTAIGCVGQSFMTNQNKCLSVDTFENHNFKFYPNPVEGILNISMDQEISEVFVMNLIGQKVMNKSVNSTQAKIDMSTLTEGTYLVKVISGEKSKVIKVVKK